MNHTVVSTVRHIRSEVSEMFIRSMGTQIVECLKVRRMVELHGESFLRRVFLEQEIHFCQSRTRALEWLSAFWATKEATIQSLGLNGGKADWTEIEISKTSTGYQVDLSGACRDQRDQLQIQNFLLAMSHCRAYATATVLAIG